MQHGFMLSRRMLARQGGTKQIIMITDGEPTAHFEPGMSEPFFSYPPVREDLAFALSVVLLGLLMMVTRRNAVSQVVGFMSLENGLVLAATGAKGMPLVVEISVAFSILIAFIVIGIFLFRIRERFDTVDLQALDSFRGERR